MDVFLGGLLLWFMWIHLLCQRLTERHDLLILWEAKWNDLSTYFFETEIIFPWLIKKIIDFRFMTSFFSRTSFVIASIQGFIDYLLFLSIRIDFCFLCCLVLLKYAARSEKAMLIKRNNRMKFAKTKNIKIESVWIHEKWISWWLAIWKLRNG